MSRLHRAAVLGAAAVAAIAGAVAIVAAATTADAETFPDAFDATVTHTVRGPFLQRYREEGGPSGRLGLPVTDEGATTYAPVVTRWGVDREVGFRRGVIYRNSTTGEMHVGVWFAWTQ